MSSFGDGNVKIRIEGELKYIADNYYSDNFYKDKESQRQFMLDVLDVLRYMCGEY